MTCTAQSTETAISLKGSTEMVCEFFYYAINSILYQRNIYPGDSFSTTTKYNLKMVETCDEKLKEYLDSILGQLKDWLNDLNVKKLVIVMQDIETKETVERWSFDVVCDKTIKTVPGETRTTDVKEIQRGIQNVIRQIVATVTFLPVPESCWSFDLLIYTDDEVATPEGWDETTAKFIPQGEEVKLKSFTTSIHTIEPQISYKLTG